MSMPPVLRFHTIQLTLGDALPTGLAEHGQRQSVFLSADLRACTQDKAMMLPDRLLVEALLTAIRSRLVKRYGSDADMQVVAVEISASTHAIRRSAMDSALVRARVEQQVYAPNKLPVGLGALSDIPTVSPN